MVTIPTDDPLAVAAVDAIHTGDLETLCQLLRQCPHLATVRLGGDDAGDQERCGDRGMTRSLLHVATDWPGHFPNGAATVGMLVEAGADVNARFTGPHSETPLHWAASSDDVDALDALIDAGADIEAAGAVIAGGTPLDDAVAFGQWHAARRLVERGAQTALWHAAALGLMDRIERHFAAPAPPPTQHPWGASGDGAPPAEIDVAFWCACHGGQREAAAYLLERGANLNWISPWDGLTPLDTARREATGGLSASSESERARAEELVAWLRSRGAKAAAELA